MNNKSGVYTIKNIVNGKIYIGSSSDIKSRIRNHLNLLRKGKHHNVILQRSFNKHKEINFKFEIICFCEKNLKLYLEQQYINTMKPFYNISKSVHAPMEGRKHSQKTKDKFKKRKVLSGEDHPNYGKSWTKEQRKLLMPSRKNQKKSDKEKDQIRKRALDNNYFKYIEPYTKSKRKKIIDQDDVEYKSLTEAAKILGVAKQSICNVLKGRRNSVKGYKFKYKEEDET